MMPLAAVFFLISCTGSKHTGLTEEDHLNADRGNSFFSGFFQDNQHAQRQASEVHTKSVSDFDYTCGILQGVDFVRRKNPGITAEELSDLEDESVLILEVRQTKKLTSILGSKSMEMSRDGLNQYLVGEVIKDIAVVQDGKDYYPSGNFYEGIVDNSIRIYFFFKGLDIKRLMTVTYYDRIFGNGMVKIALNTTNNHTV